MPYAGVILKLDMGGIIRNMLLGGHLELLPPYAPELNPVEYLWAHWKHHELANFCPKDFAELSAHARAKLQRTQRRKTPIAAFWKQAEAKCSVVLLSLGPPGKWEVGAVGDFIEARDRQVGRSCQR